MVHLVSCVLLEKFCGMALESVSSSKKTRENYFATFLQSNDSCSKECESGDRW